MKSRKFEFTKEITTKVENRYKIDFGIHYIKIVEDDEIHIYKLTIDKGESEYDDEISFVKVFRAYERVVLSRKDNHYELPYRIENFISGKIQGDFIDKETFKKELQLALKYF